VLAASERLEIPINRYTRSIARRSSHNGWRTKGNSEIRGASEINVPLHNATPEMLEPGYTLRISLLHAAGLGTDDVNIARACLVECHRLFDENKSR
jgi:hypothetical protein